MSEANKKTVSTQSSTQQLKEYAKELKQLQTDIESNDTLSVNHAKIALGLVIQAGGILIEAKKLFKHGEWEKWVAKNVPMSKSTIENYMRLAKAAAKAEHVGLLTDVESLRQAYIRVGIKKPTKQATATTTTGTEQTPEGDEGDAPNNDEVATTTPQKMKDTDKGQYDAKLNEAKQGIRTHVRKEIESANRVSWKLSTWTVANNKPNSGGANFGALLFRELQDWVAIREFTSLTIEDEVSAKAGIVLAEVVNAFIMANTLEVNIKDFVPEYSIELNPQTVEVVEAAAV